LKQSARPMTANGMALNAFSNVVTDAVFQLPMF
jgi:hypothetical protein